MLDIVYDAGKIIGLEIYIRIAFGNLILEFVFEILELKR